MPSPQGSTAGIFVGRQHELGELKVALQAALAGHGSVVTLAGEPGIGKTRTARELASYAQRQGATVLWGRCFENIGPTPFWPWVQGIRSYVRDCTEQKLLSEMGAGAAIIAEAIPEVGERLSGLEGPPPMTDPAQARLRLFDSISTFLKRASQSQPLVLVLDNLHWADRPSLLLLEFMADELSDARILILGTFRDTELSRGHPLRQTLGELTKLSFFRRISLAGLTEEDIKTFIELVSGTSPHPPLLREVHSRTAGNALFVSEVVGLLAQQGVLTREGRIAHPDQAIGIPEGVREAIGRRLDRLSDACNRMLRIASLVGREFGLEELGRLIDDLSGDELLGAAEEALAAGVVDELPDTFGRYQFSHILIQETLSSELSSTRRAGLHAQIAEVMEEIWRDEIDSHASELAYHFGLGQATLGPDKVTKYSLIAGERALAAYAYEDSMAHFQRGLDGKSGKPVDAETAALWFGLGCAQGAVEQSVEAWANIRRAFDFCVESGDVAQAVAVAEYPLFYVPGLTRATRLTAQALTLVPPESLEAGRLLARYGLLVNLEAADYAAAQEALNKALAIAEREEDDALKIRALGNAADVHWYHLNWHGVAENSVRAIELALRSANSVDIWPLYLVATAFWTMGRVEEATKYAQEMLSRAERLRHKGFMANALLQMAVVNHIKGEWEAARRFYDRGLAVAPDWYLMLGFRTQLEYELGNYDEGHQYLSRLFKVARRTPSGPTGERFYAALFPPLIARVTGVATDFDFTRRTAEEAMSSPAVTPLVALDAIFGRALIAVWENDAEEAARLYQALRPHSGTLSVMACDRLLGLLGGTMGRFDIATDRFEEALGFCRNAGYRPELAWTCHDYAQTLLESHDADGRGRAMSLIEEGLTVASAVGMRPVMERLGLLRKRAESRGAVPVEPSGITQREVDVLRLIAAGRSNRQIADELFISHHTVNYHVKNILSKTGSANRAEAATYAAHHGLV